MPVVVREGGTRASGGNFSKPISETRQDEHILSPLQVPWSVSAWPTIDSLALCGLCVQGAKMDWGFGCPFSSKIILMAVWFDMVNLWFWSSLKFKEIKTAQQSSERGFFCTSLSRVRRTRRGCCSAGGRTDGPVVSRRRWPPACGGSRVTAAATDYGSPALLFTVRACGSVFNHCSVAAAPASCPCLIPAPSLPLPLHRACMGRADAAGTVPWTWRGDHLCHHGFWRN